jgi:type IV pilus assembly protein PilW
MRTLNTLSMPDRRAHQHGFSLIEIMVGVVIGLIAVLVIYQVFAAAEGIKRNTTSAGDAQQNGLLASFMLGVELSNASNGVAFAWQKLQSCPPTASAATMLRPIPILITDGGGPTVPDQFVTNYSISNLAIAPAPFRAPSASNTPYVVQAPIGFSVGDIVVATSGGGDGAGTCAVSRVIAAGTNLTPTPPGPLPLPDEVAGWVTIGHSNAPSAFDTNAYLLNMGRASNFQQRVRYDVDATGVLRSTSLWDLDGAPNPQVPNPLASNIVNMKLLYGIDNTGPGGNPDGILDTWVTPTGAWSDASVLAAPIATLRQIKAVRLGIIVRGEQWDRDAPDKTVTLFDDTTVPFTQTFPRFDPGSGMGNYRYRFYETIIPMRNPVWN